MSKKGTSRRRGLGILGCQVSWCSLAVGSGLKTLGQCAHKEDLFLVSALNESRPKHLKISISLHMPIRRVVSQSKSLMVIVQVVISPVRCGNVFPNASFSWKYRRKLWGIYFDQSTGKKTFCGWMRNDIDLILISCSWFVRYASTSRASSGCTGLRNLRRPYVYAFGWSFY